MVIAIVVMAYQSCYCFQWYVWVWLLVFLSIPDITRKFSGPRTVVKTRTSWQIAAFWCRSWCFS